MSTLNAFIIQTFIHPWQSVKKFLPKSLFGRSLIILVTPLICVQVILGYIFFDRHTETILRLLSTTIAGDIGFIVDLIENGEDIKKIQSMANQHLNLDISLDNQNSLKRLGLHRQTWLYTFIGEAFEEKIKAPYYIRMNSDFIFINVLTKKGTVNINLSRKRLFSRTTPLVLIWTTASAFLLFIVASLFMRNQIRPIDRLAKAAERFGKGEDDINFKPEGALEVRKAGFAFQQMKNRLKRLLSERLEMLAGVSHDLRTPLTRMKLQLAIIPKTPELDALKEDVSLMQEMVEGFLLYARGAVSEENHRINIRTTIVNIIKSLKIPVDLKCPTNIKVNAKINLFNRCLTNLLLNSQQYAKKVQIRVYKKQHHIEIIIEDDGPGIPENEYENVFRPFYRLDAARNLDKGGIGLGLNIARDAIRAHGGQIYLRQSDLGGLKVLISLPS